MVRCNQKIILPPPDAVKNELISCSVLCVLLKNPSKIPRMGVEQGLDCTTAYRLLIRSRSFWDAVP